MGSTNYYNTLIEIAEDCPASTGEMPPVKGDKKSVANLQFDLVYNNPYRFTSDDILFTVFATRKELPEGEWAEQREAYFAKGQPCFRASPLTKRYGWGVHSNEEGKIAMFGVETAEYQQFVADKKVEKTKAMRSKRA